MDDGQNSDRLVSIHSMCGRGKGEIKFICFSIQISQGNYKSVFFNSHCEMSILI